MKVRWPKYLQNIVYDFSRVIFPENHTYRRALSDFNGKPKNPNASNNDVG